MEMRFSMYAYIKGKLIEASPLSVVVEAGFVGYHIFVPAHVYSKLPSQGELVLLYTSFIVREVSQTLYGFLTKGEKELFESLMGVTGIGPKVALSLIGHLSMDRMQQAISNSDIVTISKVPGIGKKTAERLIVEMRDKLHQFFPKSMQEYAMTLDSQSQNTQDAMNALIQLGYHQSVAKKALSRILKDLPDETDVGILITEALKFV